MTMGKPNDNGDGILDFLESNLPDNEAQKEPCTCHRRGHWFKSSTAHHSFSPARQSQNLFGNCVYTLSPVYEVKSSLRLSQ